MSWRSRLAAVGTDVAADSDDEVLACDPLFREVVPEHCVKIGRLRDLQRQVGGTIGQNSRVPIFKQILRNFNNFYQIYEFFT